MSSMKPAKWSLMRAQARDPGWTAKQSWQHRPMAGKLCCKTRCWSGFNGSNNIGGRLHTGSMILYMCTCMHACTCMHGHARHTWANIEQGTCTGQLAPSDHPHQEGFAARLQLPCLPTTVQQCAHCTLCILMPHHHCVGTTQLNRHEIVISHGPYGSFKH